MTALRAHRHFGSILLLAVVAMLSACSSPDATRMRYQAEKLFHQAEKLVLDADIKGQTRDEAVAKTIRDAYGKALASSYEALEKVSQSSDSGEYRQLSQIALRSASRLSQYFYAIRRYDTCTVILNKLLTSISLPPLETAVTWVNLGQTLQGLGDWDSAIVVYDKAVELVSPPVDAQGDIIAPVFSLPSQIYQIYKRVDDTANTKIRLNEAMAYYEKYARQRAGTKLGNGSWTMLGSLYSEEGRWEDAIRAYENLKDNSGNIDWRAETRIADIYAIQLRQFDRAIQFYDAIQARLTGNDTLSRPTFLFKKALVFMELKQYAQVRDLLGDLNRDYRAFYVQNSAPQFIKAQSFEREGNWERAETEYRFLIDNYGTTDQAMSSYLHVGDEMEKRGRKSEADKWMGKADEYFSTVAARGTGTQTEALAMTYRAELLRRQADWTGAAAILLQIFEKFPNETIGQNALITASQVYKEKLNDPAKADSLIQSLRKFMTTPLNELSQK